MKNQFKPVVVAQKGTVLERVNAILVTRQFIDSLQPLPDGAIALKYQVTDFQKALFTAITQISEEITTLDKEASEMVSELLESATEKPAETEFMDRIHTLEAKQEEMAEKRALLMEDLETLKKLMASDLQRNIPELRNSNCKIRFHSGFQLLKEELYDSRSSLIGRILNAKGPIEQIEAMEAYEASMRGRTGFGRMFETHRSPSSMDMGVEPLMMMVSGPDGMRLVSGSMGINSLFSSRHKSLGETGKSGLLDMLGSMLRLGKRRDPHGIFSDLHSKCRGCSDTSCPSHPMNKL